MKRPVVGITMGDPAGIGPEIIVKALGVPRIHAICHPVVFGTTRFLEGQPRALSNRAEFEHVRSLKEVPFITRTGGLPRHKTAQPPAPALRQDRRASDRYTVPVVEAPASGRIRVGAESAASGRAAIAYLERAVGAALSGEIDAIVTAPVSKAAIRKGGNVDFTGHTEYLAAAAGARETAMMFRGKRFSVALVTTHLPLREVVDAITPQKILAVIRLSHDAMMKFGRRKPRIGVAGINPHAGERGAFGGEDAALVRPAVRMARRKGIDVEGPLPADTLFKKAHDGVYDLVVAMYHDQGLAPFKLISFDEGVNITLGLPFVRTSVDHGAAFDIAGAGRASATSLVEAIKTAVILLK